MGLNPADAADDTTPPELPPEELRRQLMATRSEAARYRVKNRELSKLVGTLTGEEVPEGAQPPDLDTLKQRVAARDGGKDKQIRELKIGRALDAASRKHGVEDSELLAAYLDRAGHLKDLDVDADSFAADLDDLVAETIITKPALLGGQQQDVPSTTGARFTAPARLTARQWTKADVTAAKTPEEVDAARNAGLLNELLGRQV